MVTQQGMNLRRDLYISLGKAVDPHPSLSLAKNYSMKALTLRQTKLPYIKSATEVTIKTPRVRPSKEFLSRYSNQGNNNNQSAANISISFGLSPMGKDGLDFAAKFGCEKQGLGSLPRTDATPAPYVNERMSKELGRARNAEEVARVEMRFRKLVELHRLEAQQRQATLNSIKQVRQRREQEQAERVEKFKLALPDMMQQVASVIKADTRRARKRERIGRFQSKRYAHFWTRNHVTSLSAPRRKEVIFAQLKSIVEGDS